MSTATVPAGSTATPRGDAFDQLVDREINRTRADLRWTDLFTRLVMGTVALVGVVFVAVALDHWVIPGGLGGIGRGIFFLAIVGAGGCYLKKSIWPLVIRKINPVYAAYSIERENQDLKNSLLNLVMLRTQREAMPAKVYEQVGQQAAERLARSDAAAAVDRAPLLRWGYALVALVAIASAYMIFSPKNLFATAGRVLAPWADIPVPTRVQIRRIEPGAIQVARGGTVEVSAVITGLRDGDAVNVRYWTEDGQVSDFPVPMLRGEGSPAFVATLPASPSDNRLGVQQTLHYAVEAGDARSDRFTITMIDTPTITIESIELDYPEYTGLADRTLLQGGDIRAIEGTRVRIVTQTNQPARRAELDLGTNGQTDALLTPIDGDPRRLAAEFVLEVDEPGVIRRDGYVLRLLTESGGMNRHPVRHHLEVIPDLLPEIAILSPARPGAEVPLGTSLQIDLEGRDPDFALRGVKLVGSRQEEQVVEVPLLEEEFRGRWVGRWQFTPAAPQFAPGDVIQLSAVAEDNKSPEANRRRTETIQIRITDPPARDDGGEGLGAGGGTDGEQGTAEDQDNAGQEGEQAGGENGGASGENSQNSENSSGETGEGGQDGSEQGGSDQNSSGQEDSQNDANSEGEGANQQGGTGSATDNNAGAEGAEPNSQTGGQEGATGESNPENGATPSEQNGGSGESDSTPQSEGQGGQSGASPGAENAPSQGAPNGNPQQSASREPVPNDGSDDAEALERLQEYFEEQQQENPPNQQQDSQNQAEGSTSQAANTDQPTEGESTAPTENDSPSDGDPQGGPESREGEQDSQAAEGSSQEGSRGSASPHTEQQSGDPLQEQDQTTDPTAQNAESGHEDPGSGGAPQQAEGDQSGSTSRASETDQQTPNDSSEEGAQGSAGQPDQASGSPGQGDQPGESQGAPEPDGDINPRQKSSQGDENGRKDDLEPPAPAKKDSNESDSQGESGGDQTGGGQEGGGQRSDQEGTGTAGQNEPTEQGGGASQQAGNEETSNRGGDDVQSPGEQGKPGDQAGPGSQQRPQQGSQAGGENAGQPEQQENGQPGEQNSQQSPSPKPGETPQNGEQSRESQSADSQGFPQGAGNAGQSPHGGNAQGSQAPGDPHSGLPNVQDKANLEYAKKQADLVLDKLKNQLEDRGADQELLDKMGWSENDLRRFLDRWRQRQAKAQGSSPASQQARRELETALRSLGLNKNRVRRGPGEVPIDQQRDLRDAIRTRVPLDLQEEMQAYTRGISAAGAKSD